MRHTYKKAIDILTDRQEVNLSMFDDSYLEKAFQKRIEETCCVTPEAYFTILEQKSDERKIIINSLNNNYSEFFRNPLTFSVLERIILPSVISKKGDSKQKEIRVWSAACAAGQETYSLAILLEELKNDDANKNNFRIFATDQCESQVNQAQRGQYSAVAINNLNLKRVNQWFIRMGNIYAVKQELKNNIDFSVFDLFNEQLCCPPASIFGDFDLVVCANLLFYYKPEYQKKILDKTTDSLAYGGYLITGEAEREILKRNNFREVYPQSAIFQKMMR